MNSPNSLAKSLILCFQLSSSKVWCKNAMLLKARLYGGNKMEKKCSEKEKKKRKLVGKTFSLSRWLFIEDFILCKINSPGGGLGGKGDM